MTAAYEIIDSHVHYWQAASPARPWAPGANAPNPVPQSVDDILATTQEAGVGRIVQVVPSLMGYDNRYAFEGAESHPDQVLGVFARVDAQSPDLRAQLAALCARPKFLGIRVALLSEAQRAGFTDGSLSLLFDLAAEHGFVIALYARGYPREIAALARRHWDTRILIDHMAMNHQRPQPFEDWPDILALSSCPNIWIKASYFPEACHDEPFPWLRGQQRFQQLVDAFGAQRLIWGTNYPPSLQACSYRQSLEFMKQACAALPLADQSMIFGGTLLKLCC